MGAINTSVWMASVLWILAIFVTAAFEGMAFPWQMTLKYGSPIKGVPAIMDGFLWADLIVLPVVLGYIVEHDYKDWSRTDMLVMAVVGLVLTIAFHEYVILAGKWPATLGSAAQGHTMAGLIHIPFMAVALAIIGLHFFRPMEGLRVCMELVSGYSMPGKSFLREVPIDEAIFIGTVLLIQIQLDLHLVTHYVQRWFEFDWYFDMIKEDPKQLWMLAGLAAAIILLTFGTGGLMAGAAVVGAGVVFLCVHLVFW